MTEVKSPKKSEKKKPPKTIIRNAEYEKFIIFQATPKALREQKTQEEFAEHFGLHRDTLTDWKKTDGFWEKVAAVRQVGFKERSSEVLASFYNTLIKNASGRDVETWWKIVEGWREDHGIVFPEGDELTDEEKKAIERIDRKHAKKK